MQIFPFRDIDERRFNELYKINSGEGQLPFCYYSPLSLNPNSAAESQCPTSMTMTLDNLSFYIVSEAAIESHICINPLCLKMYNTRSIPTTLPPNTHTLTHKITEVFFKDISFIFV